MGSKGVLMLDKHIAAQMGSLTAIDKFLSDNTIDPILGKQEGRKFAYISPDKQIYTFSLNDLIKHVKKIAKEAGPQPENLPKIIKKIDQLDLAGDALLHSASPGIKFQTAIRRFFGNIGFNRQKELAKLGQEKGATRVRHLILFLFILGFKQLPTKLLQAGQDRKQYVKLYETLEYLSKFDIYQLSDEDKNKLISEAMHQYKKSDIDKIVDKYIHAVSSPKGILKKPATEKKPPQKVGFGKARQREFGKKAAPLDIQNIQSATFSSSRSETPKNRS